MKFYGTNFYKNLIMKFSFTCIIFVLINLSLLADDGSGLWLNYKKLDGDQTAEYIRFKNIICNNSSATCEIAVSEIQNAFNKLLDTELIHGKKLSENTILIGTIKDPLVKKMVNEERLMECGDEGFLIEISEKKSGNVLIIAAKEDIGLLYGTFYVIREIRKGSSLRDLSTLDKPKYRLRLLNHWDNLDGSVERGYAGKSIWKWDDLPNKISPRYKMYARANASIGINGTVLNNVNASPTVLSPDHLGKVKVIADILRPYGIRVYLSVNFSSPKELGGLPTSDPLDADVKLWWKRKTEEIYQLIPDFGGFLVKANSEGLPGPQDFGRTHADGANMLADVLKPYGGVVMWRAFVYKANSPDRAKQAYDEFIPLDGQFRSNVIIQIKNGPVDFQPREPFSPLFGSMEGTTVMVEFQITQEYLGFSDHIAYLGVLYEECLKSDTYKKGENSTVARITDGSIFNDSITAIAGVANIGDDVNWCGYDFAQSNWYVYGRLAWDHQLTSREIADEWIKLTFTNNKEFVDVVSDIMMESREAVVNYMTPMGLHHLMGWGHHYGPQPWCEVPGAREDWLPKYYHKAAPDGIGFNRSSTGSNAVSQYAEPLRSQFDNPKTCPEIYILWFHHLPWNYVLNNGNILWDELCYKYSEGVDQVREFQKTWDKMKGKIDQERFEFVQEKLTIQLKEAIWWRDACLLYFQTFSNLPIPEELDRPIFKLEELKRKRFDMKHHN